MRNNSYRTTQSSPRHFRSAGDFRFEFGVPDGADRDWRISELKKWLEIGAKATEKGVSTIICGFVRPKDLPDGYDARSQMILLDADGDTVRERLIGRYTKNGVFDEMQKVIGRPVDDFITGNVTYSNTMREECRVAGCAIVDTPNLSPEKVAKEIFGILKLCR